VTASVSRRSEARRGAAMIELPIERGAIMMFARSINDANPIYWDAT
jgi:hypothetical protein